MKEARASEAQERLMPRHNKNDNLSEDSRAGDLAISGLYSFPLLIWSHCFSRGELTFHKPK